jgi:hypothetical protein
MIFGGLVLTGGLSTSYYTFRLYLHYVESTIFRHYIFFSCLMIVSYTIIKNLSVRYRCRSDISLFRKALVINYLYIALPI